MPSQRIVVCASTPSATGPAPREAQTYERAPLLAAPPLRRVHRDFPTSASFLQHGSVSELLYAGRMALPTFDRRLVPLVLDFGASLAVTFLREMKAMLGCSESSLVLRRRMRSMRFFGCDMRLLSVGKRSSRARRGILRNLNSVRATCRAQ